MGPCQTPLPLGALLRCPCCRCSAAHLSHSAVLLLAPCICSPLPPLHHPKREHHCKRPHILRACGPHLYCVTRVSMSCGHGLHVTRQPACLKGPRRSPTCLRMPFPLPRVMACVACCNRMTAPAGRLPLHCWLLSIVGSSLPSLSDRLDREWRRPGFRGRPECPTCPASA